MLRGEPGIGKSRLLSEAARTARELGMTVLTTTGVRSEAHLPFAGLHQLLRQHERAAVRTAHQPAQSVIGLCPHRSGQVLDAIDEAGITENTIVVWSSDNGTAPSVFGGTNGPWRGNFGSGFAGGMRVPAIVRWPGKVEAGAVTDEILAAIDWLPTLASLAGESGRVPSDRPIDGIDASAFLLGKSPTSGRDHVIAYGSDAQIQSIKWRTMKVVFRYSDSLNCPLIENQFPQVFDLIEDPGEQTDLVNSMARYPNIKPGEEFTGFPARPLIAQG